MNVSQKNRRRVASAVVVSIADADGCAVMIDDHKCQQSLDEQAEDTEAAAIYFPSYEHIDVKGGRGFNEFSFEILLIINDKMRTNWQLPRTFPWTDGNAQWRETHRPCVQFECVE